MPSTPTGSAGHPRLCQSTTGALVETTEHIVVLVDGTEVAGVLVSSAEPGHLFIENVAVAPWVQGRGHSRPLLAHAEEQARMHGLAELRLYANALMSENLRFYPKLGYTEMIAAPKTAASTMAVQDLRDSTALYRADITHQARASRSWKVFARLGSSSSTGWRV